ncbi:MAG: acetyltransferase [Actinomycetota bacterium]
MGTEARVERLVIIGAGGFGREVLDVVERINNDAARFEVVGFRDDGAPDLKLLAARGHRHLGPVSESASDDAAAVLAIGDGAVRARLDAQLETLGVPATLLVSPDATFGGANRIDVGCVVCAGVRVTTNVRIGRSVVLNLNATVGHDAVLEDHVTVFPGATISGAVHVGARATIGTGANVLPGVTIGDDAFVGAGAVVTKDVEPGSVVAGIPARPLAPPEPTGG